MSCDKCKVEGNKFCSFCGVQLREVCPDGCGHMELIGRLICESKVKEVNKLLTEYVEKQCTSKDFKRVGIVYFELILWGALIITYSQYIHSLLNLLGEKEILRVIVSNVFVGTPIVCGVCFMLNPSRRDRDKKEARDEFLQKNPDYADILSKKE